jgi:hypothetical protein
MAARGRLRWTDQFPESHQRLKLHRFASGQKDAYQFIFNVCAHPITVPTNQGGTEWDAIRDSRIACFAIESGRQKAAAVAVSQQSTDQSFGWPLRHGHAGRHGGHTGCEIP